MKLFTNKPLLFICACVLVGACSSKTEEPSQPADVETVVVEETILPPTAETVPAPAPAEPAPAPAVTRPAAPKNEAILNLKAWDKKLKFLKTRFEQTTTYDGVPVSKSQGSLFYDKAKNLLRLDTTDADGKTEQTAITDKQKILILDGQGHEVTTLAWAEWQQGQPNQALFDFGNYTALLARHQVSVQEPYLLALTPKEQTGEGYTLYVTLSKEDYFPQTIKIVSDLMVTEATLTGTQKNNPLPFNTFRAGGLFQ